MKKQLAFGVLLSAISTMAFAHPDHGLTGHALQSAYAGFLHPLTGWDHLFMLLSVGFWAAKADGKFRWLIPLTFISVMTLGALLGLIGLSIFGLETVIASSVLAMGLLLVINLPISAITRMIIIAVFAIFHGMAHGIELHVQQSYAALGGMLFATAIIHCVGFYVGSSSVILVKNIETIFAWAMVLVGGYLLVA